MAADSSDRGSASEDESYKETKTKTHESETHEEVLEATKPVKEIKKQLPPTPRENPPTFPSIYQTPNMPPLSGSAKFKSRVSKSLIYDKAAYEWYWKPTPTLPSIWVRDGNLLTMEVCAEWDRAWRRYATLGVPGKGDGAGLVAMTRHGRRKIEAEYQKLSPEIKKAKEVALARYDPFCLRADGTLDYHTEPNTMEKGDLIEKCVVM